MNEVKASEGRGSGEIAGQLPRMINKKELLKLVPFTPQHILRLEKQGRFPKRKQVGSRRVGWWLHEVLNYLDSPK